MAGVGLGRGEHGKPCRYAGEAVVVSSVRHRIEMRTRGNAGCRGIDTGQQKLNVAKRVIQYLQAMPPREGAYEIRGRLFVPAPGRARDTGGVGRLMSYSLQELPDFCDACVEMGMSVRHTKSLRHRGTAEDAALWGRSSAAAGKPVGADFTLIAHSPARIPRSSSPALGPRRPC